MTFSVEEFEWFRNHLQYDFYTDLDISAIYFLFREGLIIPIRVVDGKSYMCCSWKPEEFREYYSLAKS